MRRIGGVVLTMTGLSSLPLSRDHSLTVIDLAAGWNGPWQFSQSHYEPRHDLRSSLLCGGTGAGVLVLGWLETLET
jgi:hypothetical protein